MASNESHILVINSGSSSLKFTVFDRASEEVLPPALLNAWVPMVPD